MKKKCLVIGDLNVDLIISGISGSLKKGSEVTGQDHFLDIGGSGGVFSAALSELGIRTYIVSKISDDTFGDYLLQRLKSHGTGTNKILIEKGKSTGVTVSLSYAEDKIQVSSVELVKEFNVNDIPIKKLGNVGHVHFSSYYMMDGLKRDYLKIINRLRKIYKDITFSMDTNDDPSGEWSKDIYDIFPYIDIFLVNRKEALMISKENTIEDAIKKLGKVISIVIVKLGKEGYIARYNDNTYKGAAFEAVFKDSTGAGDNFDAGFIYGFLNNMGFEKSLQIGNICGSISVEYLGGAGTKEKYRKIQKTIRKGD